MIILSVMPNKRNTTGKILLRRSIPRQPFPRPSGVRRDKDFRPIRPIRHAVPLFLSTKRFSEKRIGKRRICRVSTEATGQKSRNTVKKRRTSITMTSKLWKREKEGATDMEMKVCHQYNFYYYF